MAQHYYVTEISERLPNGRWLNEKDKLRPTDLVCWTDRKAQTVQSTGEAWSLLNISNWPSKSFYRPITPRYRILGPKEAIKKGDQMSYKESLLEKWYPAGISIGTQAGVWYKVSVRRRIHRAA